MDIFIYNRVGIIYLFLLQTLLANCLVAVYFFVRSFGLDPDLHQGRLQKVTKKVKAAEKRLKFSALRYNEEAYYWALYL